MRKFRESKISTIELEDIDFTVVYSRDSSFKKNDTFNGISDLEFELGSYAETINGYFDIITDNNGDLIAVQFYAMNTDAPEDMSWGEVEDLGYVEDAYVELKCSLRRDAIETIAKYFD